MQTTERRSGQLPVVETYRGVPWDEIFARAAKSPRQHGAIVGNSGRGLSYWVKSHII